MLRFVHGSFSTDEDDADISRTSFAHPIILINRSEKGGVYLEEAFQTFFQSGNNMDGVILTTTTSSQLRSVFNYLMTKLQKL